MIEALKLAKKRRGRPPLHLRCIETGEVAMLLEWAAAIGARVGSKKHTAASNIQSAASKGTTAHGLHFERVTDEAQS